MVAEASSRGSRGVEETVTVVVQDSTQTFTETLPIAPRELRPRQPTPRLTVEAKDDACGG